MGRQSKTPELCQALAVSLEQFCSTSKSFVNLTGSVTADCSKSPGPLEASVVGTTEPACEAPSTCSSPRETVHACLQATLKILELPLDAPASCEEDTRGEVRELLQLLVAADLPLKILSSLDSLEFEAQKDAVRVFQAILRAGAECGADEITIEYVQRHASFTQMLLQGCGRPEVALHCGLMLRACTRYPQLVGFLLEAGVAGELMGLCRHQSFDIASDAFSSLRELLLTHKAYSSTYLGKHSGEFFLDYNKLLQAEDYITQRQSLRLLGELLLNRTFMAVMIAYVDSEHFLQIHMNLLRNNSKAIQLEAFHIFKIFVVNPRKPFRVHQILHRNRERLVKLLENFSSKKTDDDQFAKDLRTVLETLRKLPAPVNPGKKHLENTVASPVRSNHEPA